MNQFIKVFFILVALVCWLFVLESEILASGFTLRILSAPSELSFDQEGNIEASFSGDPKYYANKTYYLRAVFSSEGSTNYFGFTQNGLGSWVGNSDDKSQYFQIQTFPEATWSGVIKVKNDLLSPYFVNTDSYQLKVGRYTSSSDTSADWSDPFWVNLVGPTLTPQQTAQPTQAPTQAPTASPAPTKTPSPRPIPTKSPTPKPSNTPGPTNEITKSSSPPTVLGLQTDDKNSKLQPYVLPAVFVGSGIALVGVAGYLAFKKQKEIAP